MAQLHLASASGNVFAFVWEDEVPPTFEGAAWAKRLCPRGRGFGVDGLFLLRRPKGAVWVMEHWDADGSHTFCSNGTRAALALQGAPSTQLVAVESNGESVLLKRDQAGIGICMPEGDGCGLKASPVTTDLPSRFGWVGNPQLVLRVPSVAEVDLPRLAPPLRFHPAIPGGTNVNVVEVLGKGSARIRSWERGVEGETLCCGTGCAVAAAWLAQSEGVSRWELETASGDPVTVDLQLDPDGRWRNLWLSGRVRVLGMVLPDVSMGLD